MTLTIDLTLEQQAALEAEAKSRGIDLPEFARLRLLEDLPSPRTWGERVIEKCRPAGVLGSYGDRSKDSIEFARELRTRVDEELFRGDADAAERG